MNSQKVPDFQFPIRKPITVIAPSAIIRFRCIADRCEWTCCHGWRVPVNPTHAEIFLKFRDAEGVNPFDSFLKKISSLRRGKSKSSYYLDLPGTETQYCRFLSENRRCQLQEKYGEDALCDTCLLFPRRLIQFDQTTHMTVSLACPETIRCLILTDERFSLTTLDSYPDADADWIDSDQISNEPLRELIRNRTLLLEKWTSILYDRAKPFAARTARLCESILQNDPNQHPIVSKHPDETTIGACILAIQESFQPQPSGFPADVSNAVAALFGADQAFSRMIGASFAGIDREFLVPFFTTHSRWIENYVAHSLYSEALTEFSSYLSDDASLTKTIRFTLARLQLTLNLLMLQLAAAAKTENGISMQTFMRVIYDLDRKFYQSPRNVESVIHRYAKYCENNPNVWLSRFLFDPNI